MSNNVVSNCFVANNLAYVQTLNVYDNILESPSPHYLPTIVVVRCCIFFGSRGVCIFCKMGFAMMDLVKKYIYMLVEFMYLTTWDHHLLWLEEWQVMAKLSLLVCCIKSS